MLELLTVVSLTIVVAIVPGPDFAVVLRNALVGGRLAGIMAGGVFLWFVMVTMFFTLPAVRLQFLRAKLWMERSVGILLTLFGIGIAVTTNSTRP